jgi:hypothetical protein
MIINRSFRFANRDFGPGIFYMLVYMNTSIDRSRDLRSKIDTDEFNRCQLGEVGG